MKLTMLVEKANQYDEFHYAECHYGECHYGECHYVSVIMVIVIIMSVIMFSVIKVNVNILLALALKFRKLIQTTLKFPWPFHI